MENKFEENKFEEDMFEEDQSSLSIPILSQPWWSGHNAVESGKLLYIMV